MPYTDILLEYFGPTRLMFGSDWPLITWRLSTSAGCRWHGG
ncbi:hypothetical protein [Mycobacterium pinniadriaticum]